MPVICYFTSCGVLPRLFFSLLHFFAVFVALEDSLSSVRSRSFSAEDLELNEAVKTSAHCAI